MTSLDSGDGGLGSGQSVVMARLVRATYISTCRDRWPGQAEP